jgi:hypothetical protein
MIRVRHLNCSRAFKLSNCFITINNATDPNKERVYRVKQAPTQLDIHTDKLLDWQVHYL